MKSISSATWNSLWPAWHFWDPPCRWLWVEAASSMTFLFDQQGPVGCLKGYRVSGSSQCVVNLDLISVIFSFDSLIWNCSKLRKWHLLVKVPERVKDRFSVFPLIDFIPFLSYFFCNKVFGHKSQSTESWQIFKVLQIYLDWAESSALGGVADFFIDNVASRFATPSSAKRFSAQQHLLS